jgi:precorrin-6A/cobalt-precorrin-6A reductase
MEKWWDMPARVLILGGTAEARDIATQLLSAGHDVTSSLAGVTSNPILPPGKIRSGGFGGADGLRDFLVTNDINVLIDATHPFAAVISHNAMIATENSSTHMMRYERPTWTPVAGDTWIFVADLRAAAAQLPLGAKVFITTGRKDLQPFFDRADLTGVIRTVEPPPVAMPAGWRLLLGRPPHSLVDEIALFNVEGFTHLISKNAGSDSTLSKLEAARQFGIPVVMVERPLKPDCETFADIEGLIKRLGTLGCNG